jgi:hypothetical protein
MLRCWSDFSAVTSVGFAPAHLSHALASSEPDYIPPLRIKGRIAPDRVSSMGVILPCIVLGAHASEDLRWDGIRRRPRLLPRQDLAFHQTDLQILH